MQEYNGGEVTTTVADLLTGLMRIAVAEQIHKHMEENNGKIDVDKLSIELAEEIMKAMKQQH